MFVDNDDGSDLDEEPGRNEGQAAVLSVEPVVVGVERKVVQIEKPGGHEEINMRTWIGEVKHGGLHTGGLTALLVYKLISQSFQTKLLGNMSWW